MKIFFLVLLLTVTTFISQAQVSMKMGNVPKKAQKLFDESFPLAQNGDYDNALKKVLSALDAAPDFLDALRVVGGIYHDEGRFEEAKVYLQKVVDMDPNFSPSVYEYLGDAYFYQEQYEESIESYTQFLTYANISNGDRADVTQQLSNAKFAADAIQHPVPFNLTNIGEGVNTNNYEYLPSLNAEGTLMIFTKLLTTAGDAQEDLYQSHFDGTKWGPGTPLSSSLNTEFNEGAPDISADGRTLIYAECERTDHYGYGGCDLFISHFSNGAWQSSVVMDPPINSPRDETQPCLSADGRTLYFVSGRKGGYGQYDIYKSILGDNGEWGEPVNLGAKINSAGNEQSPFIHADNSTLYFVSDGHPGMGLSDIFYSRLDENGEWGEPINIGYPINSVQEERGLIVAADGKTAYVASERPGGMGGADIYSFELYPEARPAFTTYVKGKVYDSQTKAALSGDIELIDLGTGKTIYQLNSDATTGEFLVCIPTGKNYAYNVSKSGYLFFSENFTLKDQEQGKPYQLDIPLEKINVGEKVVLKNIFFDVDKFVLLPESKVELDKLIALLKSNPKMVIEIGGHTDNTGTKDHNQTLSENRAKAVMDYLVTKGIDASRLTAKGYADTEPLQPNDTDEHRAQNRRTEFKVVKSQ